MLVFVFTSGIRSQSKPHDIMHEVYRAMKTLGYVSCMRFCSLVGNVAAIVIVCWLTC